MSYSLQDGNVKEISHPLPFGQFCEARVFFAGGAWVNMPDPGAQGME